MNPTNKHTRGTAMHHPLSHRIQTALCAATLTWGAASAQIFFNGEKVAELLQTNPYCEVTAMVSDTAIEITSVRSLPTAPESFMALVIPSRCHLDGDSLPVQLASAPDDGSLICLAEGKALWIVTVEECVGLPADCSRLLAGSTRLVTLDLHEVRTEGVTSVASMLEGCSLLEDVNIDIPLAEVTNARGLFFGCSILSSVDLSSWNLRQMEDMSEMFAGCEELKVLMLPVEGGTPSLRRAAGMFRGCTAIEMLDLRDLDLRSSTDVRQMFEGCRTLQHLTLSSHFSPPASARRDGMLHGCTSVAWWTLDYVGDMPPMLPADWPEAKPIQVTQE